MTATAHALIGGIIASTIKDPMIGLPLVIASHPLLDMIPHWDFGLGWRKKSKFKLFAQSLADLLIGVLITYLLFNKTTDTAYLISSILLSEIWDILFMPYLLFNWKFFPFSTFYKFGHDTNRSLKLPWGVMTQVASVAAAVSVSRFIH